MGLLLLMRSSNRFAGCLHGNEIPEARVSPNLWDLRATLGYSLAAKLIHVHVCGVGWGVATVWYVCVQYVRHGVCVVGDVLLWCVAMCGRWCSVCMMWRVYPWCVVCVCTHVWMVRGRHLWTDVLQALQDRTPETPMWNLTIMGLCRGWFCENRIFFSHHSHVNWGFHTFLSDVSCGHWHMHHK